MVCFLVPGPYYHPSISFVLNATCQCFKRSGQCLSDISYALSLYFCGSELHGHEQLRISYCLIRVNLHIPCKATYSTVYCMEIISHIFVVCLKRPKMNNNRGRGWSI